MLKFHNLSGSPASRDTDSQRQMGVGVAPTRQPITSPAERGARAETAGTKTAEGGGFPLSRAFWVDGCAALCCILFALVTSKASCITG